MTFDHPIVMINFIGDLVYVFDILLNFNTAFYYHGELRAGRKEIAKNYFKGHFIVDIISVLGVFALILPGTFWQYLLTLNLLRMYHIPEYMTLIFDYFQFGRFYSSFF